MYTICFYLCDKLLTNIIYLYETKSTATATGTGRDLGRKLRKQNWQVAAIVKRRT